MISMNPFNRTAKRAVLVAGAAMALAACTNARVASFVDPNYQSQLPADYRIVVAGTGMDLNEQQALIQEAQEEFSDIGITALNGLQVVPPTRELGKEEMLAEYKKAGAQVVLEVEGTGKGVEQRSEPISYTPGYRGTTVVRKRGLLQDGQIVQDDTYVYSYDTPGYVSGGYSTTRGTATYTARLIDVENGNVIWKSDSNVKRTGTNYEKHAEETAEEFVERLVDDGVIRARK